MDKNQKIISDIITWDKYSRYTPSVERRENWIELCDRDMQMHIEKYPQMTDDIV